MKLHWQCTRYSALPDAGGIRDQEYALMRRMTACANIHGIVDKWDNLKGKQIHTLKTSERKLLRSLRDWGLL